MEIPKQGHEIDVASLIGNYKQINYIEKKINASLNIGFETKEYPEILQQPYQRDSKQSNEIVSFKYSVNTLDGDNMFGFLLPVKLPFQLIHTERCRYGQSEEIVIKFQEQVSIDQNKTQEIFTFNRFLIQDLWMLSFKKSLNDQVSSDINDLVNGNNEHRRFLVIPLIKQKTFQSSHQIDWNLIRAFNEQGDPNLQLKLDSQFLTIHRQPDEQIQSYLSHRIFRSVHSHKTLYCAQEYIRNPQVETLRRLFILYLKFCDPIEFKTPQQIAQYYGFTKKEIEEEKILDQITVHEFLFTMDINNLNLESTKHQNIIQNLISMRLYFKSKNNSDVSESFYGEENSEMQNDDQMILLSTYTSHIHSTENLNSVKKDQIKVSFWQDSSNFSKPHSHVIYHQDLNPTIMTTSQYDNFFQYPIIFIQLERFLVVKEFEQSLIPSNMQLFDYKYLSKALCSPNFNSNLNENYEVLQVIGDSVLKYAVTCFLYCNFKTQDEGFMTSQRVHYINNRVLSILAFINRVHFFVQTQNYVKVCDWLPQYSTRGLYTVKHYKTKNLTSSNLADILQAIIGASFVSRYSVKQAYQLVQIIGLPIEIFPDPERKKIFFENDSYMLFSCGESDLDLFSQISINLSYSDLFGLIGQQLIDFEFINNLGTNEKKIFQQAFRFNQQKEFTKNNSYEVLEFVGDSLIEIYVMANAFRLLETLKVENSPNLMSMIKTCLLSNSFLARIALLLGLEEFLIFNDEKQKIKLQESIQAFKNQINLNQPFREFVRHEANIPKTLSDIVQSLAAALILIGGWRLFTEVFQLIFQPFLYYVVKFHSEISWNVYEELKIIVESITGKKEVQFHQTQTISINPSIILTTVFIGKRIVCGMQGETEQISKQRAFYKAISLLESDNQLLNEINFDCESF